MSSNGTCYQWYGRGECIVVLIHGLGFDQTMWQWQTDALCQHYRVLTYDLTGMGKSTLPLPGTTPSLSMFSQQLKQLLNELDIDSAAIAGFSPRVGFFRHSD